MIELIDFAGDEGLIGFFSQSLSGGGQLLQPFGSDGGDDFADLKGQAGVDFLQGSPAAHQEVPDGDGEFAGDGGGGEVDGAFAGQEFFAPLGQRVLGATEDGVGSFDEKAAEVFAAMAPDAPAPFFIAAVVEGRVEADVFDEFFRIGKAVDVADDGPEGKGNEVADAAEPDDGQELGVGQHFLGDEAAPMGALFIGMAELEQQTLKDLPLARGPVPAQAQERFGPGGFGQSGAWFESDAVVAEVGQEAVAGLSGAFDGLAVGMEPVPADLVRAVPGLSRTPLSLR